MRSSRLPESFDLVLHDDRRIPLRLIGPSAQGWVCATTTKDACYRLIRIGCGDGRARDCEDAPVERRQRFREWRTDAASAPAWTRHPAAAFLAPITDDGQAQIASDEQASWYYVRYDVPYATTLVDILAGPDVWARLDAIILVLYRMYGWWRDLRPGLLPSAADIVFDAANRPLLLPTPAWRYPDFGALAAEPSRALSLAPEYLRGVRTDIRPEALDRFAVGALALQAFRGAPVLHDIESDLLRVATGGIWQELTSRIPFWLQRLPATVEAEGAVRQLLTPDVDARSSVDLLQVARTLENCRRRMEPVRAVRELLEGHRADDAYALLNDILLVDSSGEMLLAAAEVAVQCHRLLDAVDLLERALDRPPQPIEAYRLQFEILTSAEGRADLDDALALEPSLGDYLDARLSRNLTVLDAAMPAFDWEDGMIGHLAWRGKLVEAARFIYTRLFDEKQVFLWWKFPLRFKYVRTLVRAGLQLSARGREPEGRQYVDRAGEELRLIKEALLMAHREGRMQQEQRDHYFAEAAALDRDFNLLRQTGRVS